MNMIKILKENIEIRNLITDNMELIALEKLREQFDRIYDNWQVKENILKTKLIFWILRHPYSYYRFLKNERRLKNA